MGLISNGSTIFDAGAMSVGGSMTFIKKLTASSSATVSFVDGSGGVVLDDTYKEYLFTFNNIHPSTDNVKFQFQTSTDSGSNYGVTATSTSFRIKNNEPGNSGAFGYRTAYDLAQQTGFQTLSHSIGADADQSIAGSLQLFNPSSTTYVKNFIARFNNMEQGDETSDNYTAGYFNTTSAVDAIQFKMESGNIDAGDICLYGIA
jgi:hypothetical protein